MSTNTMRDGVLYHEARPAYSYIIHLVSAYHGAKCGFQPARRARTKWYEAPRRGIPARDGFLCKTCFPDWKEQYDASRAEDAEHAKEAQP